MTGPSITWVAGRRKAIARAVAIYAEQKRGGDFARLTTAERNEAVEEAMAAVKTWTGAGLLSVFEAEYMEQEDGGDPLVKWPENAAKKS